jgi:hypothetical protein
MRTIHWLSIIALYVGDPPMPHPSPSRASDIVTRTRLRCRMTQLILVLGTALLSACVSLTPRNDCGGGVITGTGCLATAPSTARPALR